MRQDDRLRYNTNMVVLGIILVAILIIFLAAIKPETVPYSYFELKRRSKVGERDAKKMLQRREFAEVVVSWQKIVVLLFFAALSFLLVQAWGWLVGGISMIAFALCYQYFASLIFIDRVARRMYRRAEARIFTIIQKHSFVRRIARDKGAYEDTPLGSREELLYKLGHSSSWLVPNEKRRLLGALRFTDLRVSDVMTPRSSMETVSHGELLGPLSIDTLHKTGHRYFPVTDGSDIVGLFNINQFLSVKSLSHKETFTVGDVMERDILFVEKSASLEDVLRECLRAKSSLAIVRDAEEVAGLITVSDILRIFLGDEDKNSDR